MSDPTRLRVARRLAAVGVALLLLASCEVSPAAPQPPLTASPQPTLEATPQAPGTAVRDAGGPASAQAEATRTPGPTASPTQADARETQTPDPSATATSRADAPRPSERSREPAAGGGAARDGGVTEPRTERPQATPTGLSPTGKGATSPDASTQGQEYTWSNGDRVERVRLQLDLVAQPTSLNTNDDIVARDDGESSIVQRQPRHEDMDTEPVFRSQVGDLMTLPGGVLLALDAAWDDARVTRFFSDNGIDASRVQGRDFAVNAFLVETEPGLPSLNLANRLAGQEGALISSPNWRTEVSLR